MTRHPCYGRSKAARIAFEQIAVGNDRGHPLRTLDALMDAGLITRTWQIVGKDVFGPIRVPVYHVPIAIHMQW